jgi:transposase
MSDDDTKNVEEGREYGRRAAEKFKHAAEEGRDLKSIIAFWPKDPEHWRNTAREMIADEDPLWQRIGRRWIAYVDSFEMTWPQHKDFV